MNMLECSVVMIQYNSDWDHIYRTLKSILGQEDCSYEIIVADDGSKNNYFERIEKVFNENSFSKYHLVHNKQNVGTVKNIISGIKVAKGKYVRVIAPGDMLYSKSTLRNIVQYMNEHHAKEVFGRMKFYQCDGDIVNVYNKQVPFDLQPYISQNIEKMKNNLLILGDNISGASYTWDREYYLSCLNKIVNKVVYLEDCLNIYTVLDGNCIFYMDEYVTWYEYGSGVSTNKSNKWNRILAKDWISFYEELRKHFPNENKIEVARKYYVMSLKGFWVNKCLKNLMYIKRYFFAFRMSRMIDGSIVERFQKSDLYNY